MRKTKKTLAPAKKGVGVYFLIAILMYLLLSIHCCKEV